MSVAEAKQAMRISGYSGCEGCRHTPLPRADSKTSRPERFAAAAADSTTAQLSLTTAEGDKVVLSFSNASSGAVATEGTDYASIRNRRSEVKIQVEGNLNENELRDIRKLARIVSRAANDVLRGDNEQAARRIAKAEQLEGIQSFAFSLNRQIGYRYDNQSGSITA